MIGEWIALPVWYAAGSTQVGDALYDKIFHPTAGRLLQICEAVPRLKSDKAGRELRCLGELTVD
jgi:hypothetical protein